MNQWVELLTEQIRQTTLIEWVAVILGVAEVLLAKRNNILLYPAGIGGSAIGIILFIKAGLFADAGLSFYYVIVSIYGWIIWSRRKNEPPLQVAYANKQEWFMTLLIAFGGGIAIYWILITFTPSTVPVMDAWVTSSAWAGTWLLARRRIENWVVLNVSNLFAIPLLFYKHLPLFALLTLFLFIIAIFGYFDWQKVYRTQQKLQPVAQ
ncbi:nicotinamide riboside transporter PnuC [Mucilaginibacter jinjuensis]|uniref:Nicotinamide riboside transporter PnuC n=1 Tax=Mucilaginibacter jinjuensis TaxID=1176721 RepID=A0ABY7T8B4_9SPHI|nr:nicotinamide riboside transporter PnuC [Mucilaginibacter jinjuensis]WCT12596.1 nicotinamide riboside transporter PnuC [Mucilaginibacter jinjuensis]